LILFILSYLGGVLTIVSPCILPVLPFVFARADRPFLRSGLPLLLGMALTFALVATLATLGGSWAVRANQYGRWAAIILLTFFGLTLLSEKLADRLTRPLVALGDRLSVRASGQDSPVIASFLLGVATGLLWAPCAGPILGLILTGAAIKGASTSTTLLLLAYAAGAATSLAAALLIGGRVFAAMKKSLGAGEWVRRGLGVAVLAGVIAIALGVDTGFLTKLSLTSTTGLEQMVLEKSGITNATKSAAIAGSDLPVEGVMPALDGATLWLNSPPLTPQQLRGKVVLVDFWTYSCINCLRSLPYVRAWQQKYKDHGLVVIGIHSPEFAFEKEEANVRQAIKELGIAYPVAMDNDLKIWQAFNNEYWPAHYFIDAQGRIRGHQFGEGDYDNSERTIRKLLTEAGYRNVPGGIVDPQSSGAQAAADMDDLQSPETYIGYSKAQNFIATAVPDMPHAYAAASSYQRNQWGLMGDWIVGAERATLNTAPGGIVFRFHARDLHLVLGAGEKPVRFRVTLDGKPPGAAHGADTDAAGNGTVGGERLYQLIRQGGMQNGAAGDHMFQITFLDPGLQAFSFTFG
jgi:cytochrome c biogenesis protein CcdA/thiol-disulfide isomerase/thioredoxin